MVLWCCLALDRPPPLLTSMLKGDSPKSTPLVLGLSASHRSAEVALRALKALVLLSATGFDDVDFRVA